MALRSMTVLERIGALTIAVLLFPGHTTFVDPPSRAELQPLVEPSQPQIGDFKQELVVCNAYHSQNPLTVQHNGKYIDVAGGIPFKQCREVPVHVMAKDKIDVASDASAVGGSFEIGQVPSEDSFLLLVVESADPQSAVLKFQSHAFPVQTEGDFAHLAVVDTVKENSHFPMLRMEDHITDKHQKQRLSKRIELVHFNRIYNIEQGSFDINILDHEEALAEEHGRGKQVTKGLTRTLNLRKNRNYVVMRVPEDHVGQSLVVYPDLNSGVLRYTVTALTIMISCLLLDDAMDAYPVLAALM